MTTKAEDPMLTAEDTLEAYSPNIAQPTPHQGSSVQPQPADLEDTQLPQPPPTLPPWHPHQWRTPRRISIAILLSLSQLTTLMTASVMAAALPQISYDLNLSTSATQITFSVYFLGLAFGPLLLAALSETFGRKPVWVGGNLWYCLWNSLCPVGDSAGLMVVGRLCAGLGASVGIALTGPVMADMYGPEKRGRSLMVATFLPYMGPALGPILGGLMTQYVHWPWLFWIFSIFDVSFVLVATVVLHESYAPILQQRHNIANTDPEKITGLEPRVVVVGIWQRLKTNLARPFNLLLRRPVIQVLALILALNFGIYCVTLSTFAVLWLEQYHESAVSSTLHYISIALGGCLASQGGGYLTDIIWKRLRRKAHGAIVPEYRVPMMLPGAILLPAGLIWYGWSAENRLHWLMVDAGVFIFSLGSFLWSQAGLAYLLDEFVHDAASANAAVRVLSYVLAFVLPIVAPKLYEKLGYGWGNTLLALILIVCGWPLPIALWKYGVQLRTRGRNG